MVSKQKHLGYIVFGLMIVALLAPRIVGSLAEAQVLPPPVPVVPVEEDDDDDSEPDGPDFNDERLDIAPDAALVAFCNDLGGLDVFIAVGGNAFSLNRDTIEGGLALARVNREAVVIASGDAGSQLTAFPDGGLLLSAPGYNYTVPANACNGFRADYGAAVTAVVDEVETIITAPEADQQPNIVVQPVVTEPQSRVVVVGGDATTHTVQRGENLFRIGIRYDVPWREIARVNGITDVTRVEVGQLLVIPSQ